MIKSASVEAQQPTRSQIPISMIGLVMLLALCFMATWYPLDNGNDFWAHAAIGRWIVTHGSVPHHALFLWTSQQPWIAHSWLSEVCMYAVTRVGGDGVGAVLALLSAVAFAVTAFGMIWRSWDPRMHTLGPALALFT